MSQIKTDAQPSQADIYAALAAQSSFRKPAAPTSAFTSFSDPSTELISSASSSSRVNSRRVYCPREGCGSLLLLEKAGEVVEAPVDVLPYPPLSPFTPPSSSTLLSEKETAPPQHLYLNVPTPFQFENIGYSRPDKSTVLPTGTPGLTGIGGDGKGKVKWLICAECDMGPLGWGFEGSQDGWIDMRRVRYAGGEKKG